MAGFMGEDYDPTTDPYNEYGETIVPKKDPLLAYKEASQKGKKYGLLRPSPPTNVFDWGENVRREYKFWLSEGEPDKALATLKRTPPNEIMADFLPFDAGMVGSVDDIIKRGLESKLLAKKPANTNVDPFPEHIKTPEEEAIWNKFQQDSLEYLLNPKPIDDGLTIPEPNNVVDFTKKYPELYETPNRIDDQIEGRTTVEDIVTPSRTDEEVLSEHVKLIKEELEFARTMEPDVYLTQEMIDKHIAELEQQLVRYDYQINPPRVVVDNTKGPDGHAAPYKLDWDYAEISEYYLKNAPENLIRDADGGIAAVKDANYIHLRDWADFDAIENVVRDPKNMNNIQHADIVLQPFQPYNEAKWKEYSNQAYTYLKSKNKGKEPQDWEVRNEIMWQRRMMPPDPKPGKYYYVYDGRDLSNKNILVFDPDYKFTLKDQLLDKIGLVETSRKTNFDYNDTFNIHEKFPEYAKQLQERYGLKSVASLDPDALIRMETQFDTLSRILGIRPDAMGLGGRLEVYPEIPSQEWDGMVWMGTNIKLATNRPRAGAHEFAHALDNYMSSTFGESSYLAAWPKEYRDTAMPQLLEKNKGRPFEQYQMEPSGAMQDIFMKGARSPVQRAWLNIQKELTEFSKEFQDVHKFHGSETYTGNRSELFARALDSYIFTRGLEKGINPEFLGSFVTDVASREAITRKLIKDGNEKGEKYGAALYTTPNKNRESMFKAFDEFFSELKTTEVTLEDGRRVSMLYALPLMLAGGAGALAMGSGEAQAGEKPSFDDWLNAEPGVDEGPTPPTGSTESTAKLTKLWSKYYHTADDFGYALDFMVSNDFLFSGHDDEAVDHIENATWAVRKQLNGNPDFLKRLLFMTYKHESAAGKYTSNKQSSASGWWQVLVPTAKDIIRNSNMWDEEVAKATGYPREVLGAMSDKQLKKLLQSDQQLNATFAALVYIRHTKAAGERLE